MVDVLLDTDYRLMKEKISSEYQEQEVSAIYEGMERVQDGDVWRRK